MSETKTDNVKQTNICIFLDISGSMKNSYLNPQKWDDSVEAFEKFITTFQKEKMDVRLTLTLFNNKSKNLCKDIDINEFKSFPKDIIPNGGTSLFDTVIEETVNINENDKNFIVILTDGNDTTSKNELSTFRNHITQLQKKGIEFIFLGADMDSFTSAELYGMSYAVNVSLDSQDSNICDISRNLSNNICNLIRNNSSFGECPELASQYSVQDNLSPDNSGQDNLSPDNSGQDNSGQDNLSPEMLKRKLDDTFIPVLKRQKAICHF